MTVRVQDFENHVPELFDDSEFVSVIDDPDVIFSSTFGDIGPSDVFTVYVNREPDILTAHVDFFYLTQLRPNHVFLTSAWSNQLKWQVPHINFCSNLMSTVRHNQGIKSVTIDRKKYDALCLFGGNTHFRNSMFLKLKEKNILENCLINLQDRGRNQNADNKKITYQSTDIEKYDIPEFKKNAYQSDGSFFSMISLEHNFWLSEKIPYDLYNMAYLNVVTESAEYVPELFYMSEKISKTLFLGMPFLVFGCCGYLKYLQDIGFKTYGDYIDEGYDDIVDQTARSNAIVDIIEDFVSWPEDKKINFLHNTQAISNHNRTLSTNHQHWLKLVKSQLLKIN